MQSIYYELSILAKSVHFKNLSSAALHVGLSQPQLTRIIQRIEEELKLTLLDRSSKRKSGWTPSAFELSQIFDKSAKQLHQDLSLISENYKIQQLHIGTLEGLVPFAIKAAKKCFDHLEVREISLNIYDLNELEAHFTSDQLDIIFTSNSPGKQKYKYSKELGYQQLELQQKSTAYSVQSSFEYLKADTLELKKYDHVFISNSLAIKRQWLEEFGGTGILPSEAKSGSKPRDAMPILMIGSELLNEAIWNEISKTQ